MPRATVQWQNARLGEALLRLSQSVRVPIFLDRRVNPDERVNLVAENQPLDDVLARLSEGKSWGVAWLETLVYVGPRETTDRLRTLAALRREDVDKLPREVRRAYLQRGTFRWPRLSEPRLLVAQLVAEEGLTLRKSQRIPHDLWPAGSLPELSLTDRLTVLLAGFDLTFRPLANGREVEIVAIERPIVLTRQFSWTPRSLGSQRELRQMFPDAQIDFRPEGLRMTGRWEDHERLGELLTRSTGRRRREEPIRRVRTEQRFSLRIRDKPLGLVLDELAERLDLELEMDESALRAAGVPLDRPISFQVKNVDLDELLTAVLGPAGLEFQRDDKHVHISPSQ